MSDKTYITEDMMPALQGVVPAVLSSASSDGIPNVTYISQVYYVDENHVALSRQFFNKTIRNIGENPNVCVVVTCPVTFVIFKLHLRFLESQTSGDIYDSMFLQLQVIAGNQQKADTFALMAADIYEIGSVEKVYCTGS